MNDDNITDALWDVDEEEIENRLAESDCFLYSLAKSIVAVKCYGADVRSLTTALDMCMNKADEIHQELATKIAQDKDDAHRFQCEMKDSFDDYQWRTA
jgi:hypothetical protein